MTVAAGFCFSAGSLYSSAVLHSSVAPRTVVDVVCASLSGLIIVVFLCFASHGWA